MSQQTRVKQEPTTTHAQNLLIEFLRDHDADCPVCSYNLRGLTRPVCPECRQELALSVCTPHLKLGWLFVVLAPCFFSGIAACFVCIPTVAIYIEDGILVLPLAGAVLFGFCSGLFAIILAFKHRNRFIALPRSRQRSIALIVWLAHIVALMLFFGFFAMYI